MSIQGTLVNGLSTTSPILTDIALSTEIANPTILKRNTWQSLFDLFNTGFSSIFSKYSGDADFYQYSIVCTVASGNLTGSLKNFEGNDPTPTKPVKINIGGVVRTITSALSFTTSAGLNTFNSGGTELATKEVDYFVYLAYSTVSNSVIMAQSRIPYIMTQSDGDVTTPANEKFINRSASANSTDSFVNIGRFNAILSAGGAYTWSIPGNSTIVNNPILQTRYLDYTPVGAGYTAGGARYRIDGNNLNLIIDSTANITGNITTPFTSANTVDNQFITSAGTAVLPKNSNTITVATNPQNISGFYGI